MWSWIPSLSFSSTACQAPRVPRPTGCHLDQHLGSRMLMESILGLAARTKNSVGMEQTGVNVAQSGGLPGVSLLTLL